MTVCKYVFRWELVWTIWQHLQEELPSRPLAHVGLVRVVPEVEEHVVHVLVDVHPSER